MDKKIDKYISKLDILLIQSLGGFYTWQTLNNITIVEYDKFSNYGQFFIVTKESIRYFLLIQLGKIFDKTRGTISIYKFIDFLKKGIKNNKGITEKEIYYAESLLLKNEKVIKKIKEHRNYFIAHESENQESGLVSIEEIENIYYMLIDILNTFSYAHSQLILDYSNTKKRYIKDTQLLLKKLR